MGSGTSSSAVGGAAAEAGAGMPSSFTIQIGDKTDEELANALLPLFQADPERFLSVVNAVKFCGRHTRPRLPPSRVEDVELPPQEALKKIAEERINPTKLERDTPEGKGRLKQVRRLQYRRWDWVKANLPLYLNVLRASGHSDERIQHMLDGTPLCFPDPAAYTEIRTALAQLAVAVEAEMGWERVGFIATGSSVPGFSQNPLKGFADLPSKITDPQKSDVDICIVADGVNATVARLKSQHLRQSGGGGGGGGSGGEGRRAAGGGGQGGSGSEPQLTLPTTCTPFVTGVRFGCVDLSNFCKAAAEFHKKWTAVLPGGLQLTFAEDDYDIPPWEARIPLDDVAPAPRPATTKAAGGP